MEIEDGLLKFRNGVVVGCGSRQHIDAGHGGGKKCPAIHKPNMYHTLLLWDGSSFCVACPADASRPAFWFFKGVPLIGPPIMNNDENLTAGLYHGLHRHKPP